jgi:hydrogenase expression/formation protein HypE
VNHPPGHDRVLATGKLPTDLLADLLGELPPLPPEVRLGARIGEDACGIDVSEGTLVVAADPITLTAEEAARLAVLVNANDVAVSGARPRWFLAVVLLPPETHESLVRALFAALDVAASEIGVAVVGGHTEVTPAVAQPIVVGQMLGLTERGAIVTTGGFEAGDAILQVRPAPIEGAAVLAGAAAERLGSVEDDVVHAARAALDDPGISLVEPALLAVEVGAKALHDPTEGGLLGGLWEMALAAGVGIRVDRGAVLWFEPGVRVCQAVGCDPWSTLASGTLLAAFPGGRADEAVAALAARGHEAAVIGRAEEGSGVSDVDGAPLPWPERDEVARLLADR